MQATGTADVRLSSARAAFRKANDAHVARLADQEAIRRGESTSPTPFPATPKPRVATWALVTLCSVTAAYLALEVAFSADLLDVLGREATATEAMDMERAGRLVSGLAVAVAVLGLTLPKRENRPRVTRVLLAACFAVASLAATYCGERSLVDTVVEGSSPAFRLRATKAAIARSELFRSRSAALGLASATEDPSWKAYRALFSLAAGPDDVDAHASRAAADHARAAFPTASALRRNAYDPAVRAAMGGYDLLVQVRKAHADAARRVDAEVDKAWKDFMASLRHYGARRDAQFWAAERAPVAKFLADKGIRLPPNVDMWDRSWFDPQVRAKAVREVEKGHADALRRLLGDDAHLADRAVDPRSFLSLPGVQSRLRAGLGLPPSGPPLVVSPTEAAFGSDVLVPLREAKVRDFGQSLRSGAGFADGGPFAEEGRDAVRSAVVPALAIAFSLAGALVHAFKSVNVGSTLLSRLTFFPAADLTRRRAVASACAVGVTACAAGCLGAVADVPGYGGTLGSVAANLERAAYPVGRLVGRTGLSGSMEKLARKPSDTLPTRRT